MRWRWGICLLLLPQLLGAVDYRPWLSRDFEFQPWASYRYQQFSKVNGNGGSFSRNENDSFFAGGIGFAAIGYGADIDVEIAKTSHQNFACDHFSLTGKYQLSDDVIGDPVSIVTGLTFTHAFKHSLFDISSFHHGKFEYEWYLSAGREKICESFWMSRFWGVVAVGIADRGSPWIRLNCAWERNWWDLHRVQLFARTLWGLGDHGLSEDRRFRGYGSVAHQSIDIGLGYVHEFENSAKLGLDYAYRIYARNFPMRVNTLMLTLVYPLGPNQVFGLFYW